MSKTKPTVVPAWVLDNVTNIVAPGSKATDGYEFSDPLPSAWLNYHLNKLGQWAQYLNAGVDRIIYVNDAAGNDTTGDGSAALPYKTAMKAFSECPENSFVSIVFTDVVATNQLITANITLKNQTIFMLAAFGSILQHNVDSSGATNQIYTISMSNSTVISFIPEIIGGIAPAKAWGTSDSPYHAASGKNYYFADSTITMCGTGAASATHFWVTEEDGASVDCFLSAAAAGQVDTNSNGATILNFFRDVITCGESLYSYQADAGIDDPVYWVGAITFQNPVWRCNFKTNASYPSGLRKTAGGGPESVNFADFRARRGADSSGTSADGTDGEWESKLEECASNYTSVTGAGLKVGQITEWKVTKSVSGNFVESADFELQAGGYAGSKFYDVGFRNGGLAIPFYVEVAYTGGADTCDFYPYLVEYGEKNPGVNTNIKILK